ncbi:sulfatase [Rhodopirellula islandica]|uniref:Sulfatase n=1 Tax=Rhodopirellula islandica TaxID=595434 RepID=A0A0J1B8C9_RHOIS|nr:sulfatase [Rhodopirellula islandica]KLU02818.1 sulfatase [Rhodopirellula islandica]
MTRLLSFRQKLASNRIAETAKRVGALALALFFIRPALGEERPNVLLIIADDLNCAIGPYGDPNAITPHLDALAERGLVFDRTYCQQAVCNPSRSSFLTGLRPDTVGVDDLRKSFRETAPNGASLVTLPQHFKNHGYFCQDIGKIFHNMGDTQDRQSWSMDEAFHAGTHAADTVHSNTPVALRARKIKKAPVTEALDVPDTAYRDGQISRLAASVIRDYPRDSAPFFLGVGFWRPHLPFVAPKKYWDLYDPEQITAPELESKPLDVPDIAMHISRELHGYDGVPKQAELSPELKRHLRHGYYASISFLDAQVGLILDALKVSGQQDNTLVAFVSDHGFHIGEKTLWGKTSNFELDARVPLIIADPRTDQTGQRTNCLTELVDLYPTLASLAGIADDLPENLEGSDLSSLLTTPNQMLKVAAFTQHQHPFYAPREKWIAWGYSVRSPDWRYTQWRSIQDDQIIAEELYDHRTDPTESQNVVEQHPEIARKHAKQLANHPASSSGRLSD